MPRGYGLLLPLAALLILVHPSVSGNVPKNNPSVVIVGAGASGLAAAAKLLENGVTNIQILEAEDRIGGRVNSVKFGDAYVDIGAEFCHGQENNVVYEMVKDMNILTHSEDFEESDVLYSNGSKLQGQLMKDWSKFLHGYMDGDFGKPFGVVLDFDESEMSMAEIMTKAFNSTILEKYKNDEASTKVLHEAFRSFELIVISMEGSFTWDVSAARSTYETCAGDQSMTWSGRGFKTILEVLLKAFPDPKQRLPIDDKISLNKKVSKITWDSPEAGVTVECSDQTTYKADHVIVTPSVGVLKHDHANMFTPQLPKEKQDAIKNVGLEGVVKIMLHFPNKWWTSGIDNFYYIWNKDDLKELKNAKSEISWIDGISSVVNAPNNTNVLIFWVCGPNVPEVEKLPEKSLLEGSMHFLGKFLGAQYNITAPDKMIHSSWYSNPNFRGTWSFDPVDSMENKKQNRDELAKPLLKSDVPVVLFAGEASNPIHWGTVQGAIETGRREAERIINMYKKN